MECVSWHWMCENSPKKLLHYLYGVRGCYTSRQVVLACSGASVDSVIWSEACCVWFTVQCGAGCGGDGWGMGYALFTGVFMDIGFVEGRQRFSY
jgi:hypothetical protein